MIYFQVPLALRFINLLDFPSARLIWNEISFRARVPCDWLYLHLIGFTWNVFVSMSASLHRIPPPPDVLFSLRPDVPMSRCRRVLLSSTIAAQKFCRATFRREPPFRAVRRSGDNKEGLWTTLERKFALNEAFKWNKWNKCDLDGGA